MASANLPQSRSPNTMPAAAFSPMIAGRMPGRGARGAASTAAGALPGTDRRASGLQMKAHAACGNTSSATSTRCRAPVKKARIDRHALCSKRKESYCCPSAALPQQTAPQHTRHPQIASINVHVASWVRETTCHTPQRDGFSPEEAAISCSSSCEVQLPSTSEVYSCTVQRHHVEAGNAT